MKINCYTESEIKNIIYNELTKRDKILNKTQLNELVKQMITEHLRTTFGELFDLRKDIRRLKEDIKSINKKIN